MAKQLWHVVYYMIRKGISKQNLLMELNLLLKCGKIAGKAIANFMTFHHDDHLTATRNYYSAFSCRSMDPNLAFYNPTEVEFSCSNTPAYHSLFSAKRKHRRISDHHKYDAATIAKAFQILNSDNSDDNSEIESPAWIYRKSPVAARQLKVTDSPFPVTEDEEEEVDGHVDREAEEFISRFYEQLRLQQRVSNPVHSRV